MMGRGYLLLACLLVFGSAVMAQPLPLGVAYYDVDKLYDTELSGFYDDSDYTSAGRYHWDTSRYQRKVESLAAVIDSLGLPLVALRGVENEQVVRDLVGACKRDYAYVHRTQDFSFGMDFALLYFGDAFVVERVRCYDKILCVEGEFYDKPLAVVMHYRSSELSYVARELRSGDDTRKIIVMGASYDTNFEALGLRDMTVDLVTSGFGTQMWRGRWQMSDKIASDIDGSVRCGIYIRRWLLDREGRPRPTYGRGRYVGGCSSHLPVYAYFDEFFAL